MTLNRVEILGYRGFSKRGILNLSIPNGEAGSGLTVITGPNNSGKSSILESIRARSGAQSISFTVGARNPSLDQVEIKYSFDTRDEYVRSIRKGSSETKRENVDKSFDIFVLPSRRTFNPYFSRGSSFSRMQFSENSSLPAQRSSSLTFFEYRLFQIVNDSSRFNELLCELLGYTPDWSIDQSDNGQYFLKFYNGATSHSSDGMGEGIISIFAIVDALYDSSPGGVIVIDEPELSLHPSLQKKLAKMIVRFAKDRQIIIATHSPYFVDINSLRAGGHLVRVTTGINGTEIHQLSKEAKDAISSLSNGNLYNPHVFGLDARELFFQDDCIILTEGQEDVLLYPAVASQVNLRLEGSFFGWGAGGAGNIRHLCKILHSLGFSKVTAILDGDKESEIYSLATEFVSYMFFCIPAKDVRTKEEQKAKDAVEGLLDKSRNLRIQYFQPITDMISEINKYMKS